MSHVDICDRRGRRILCACAMDPSLKSMATLQYLVALVVLRTISRKRAVVLGIREESVDRTGPPQSPGFQAGAKSEPA